MNHGSVDDVTDRRGDVRLDDVNCDTGDCGRDGRQLASRLARRGAT